MNVISPHVEADEALSDAQLALTEMQLRQLAELREIGMSRARALDGRHADEKLPAPVPAGHAFAQVAKAIRQIMALEQETIGLREKRIARVRQEQRHMTKQVVRRSVEHSLVVARPGTGPSEHKRLLADLFDRNDTRDYLCGNPRDIIIDICRVLGVTPDLSIWEEPRANDIHLKAGHDWVVPANGDKPYTLQKTPIGHSRVPFDSPLLDPHGADPPDDG
jgi:hypothetical protein